LAEDQAEAAAPVAHNMGTSQLSDREKLDWIRLIRTDAIGPVTFHELIGHFGSAGAALEAVPELSRRGGRQQPRNICPLELAEAEWEAAEKTGARIIAWPEADYPPLLRHISAPPPLLFTRGDPALAARDLMAIVGSRNASAIGRQFAAELARELGSAGVTIVSGLARGIDTAAHEAALPTGTIAVIAGGIDYLYPPENAALHEAIAACGLLLTECPPGFAPRGQDFPRRNRIISGVSSGVIVVEAAKKSGSLITARLSLEQGREVFAVPGHPLDPRGIGTNGLIKAGAHLVTSADDVLMELFSGFRRKARWEEAPARTERLPAVKPAAGIRPAAGDRENLLAALSFTPTHPDILLRQTGLSPRSLTVALLELDLAGRIERHRDERISLKPVSREAR
jgi:DNA processing protein